MTGSADRKHDGGPRLAALLLVSGVAVSFAFGALHPGEAEPNDHAAAFAEYARSELWIGVHLGQFAGMAALIAGLLVLGSVAGAALALYGALQAVDGVALKHAVDAWAAADGAEKSVRFAAAEDVRWLEWGMRSYQSFVLGAALILIGIAVAGSRRFPRPVGYVMGLSGTAFLVQGWIIGAQGFSAGNSVPTLAGIVLILVWTLWLLASSLRRS